MGRDFISQMEDARKRDLLARRTTRKSLDFEIKGFGTRRSRSTRKCLQEKLRVIGSKSTTEYTKQQIDEWIEATARADMLKAGDFEDLHSKREDIGGFVRAHVSYSAFCSYLHPC